MLLTLASPALPQPNTQPDLPRHVASSLRGLSDPDPAVRAKSREALLGLSRPDLPLLQTAIRQQRRLEPGQTSALKDIVTHVFLTGDSYPTGKEGFLGITMPQRADRNNNLQIVVERRMPGFCAFGSLQDGDAILDLEERPLPRPAEPTVFIDIIKQCKPGQTIHLKVLRQGQIIRVPVKLDARPSDNFDASLFIQDLLLRRAQEAEAYWQIEFAPLTPDKPQTRPLIENP